MTRQSQRVKITPRATVDTNSQLGNPIRTWRQSNQSPHDLKDKYILVTSSILKKKDVVCHHYLKYDYVQQILEKMNKVGGLTILTDVERRYLCRHR